MVLLSCAPAACNRIVPATAWTGRLLLFVAVLTLVATPGVRGSLLILDYNDGQLRQASLYDHYRWSNFPAWAATESVQSGIMNYSRLLNTMGSFDQLAVHLLDFEASNSYQFNFGIVQVLRPALAGDASIRTPGGGGMMYQPSPATFSTPISLVPPSDSPEPPSDQVLPPTVPEPSTLILLAAALPLYGIRRATSGRRGQHR